MKAPVGRHCQLVVGIARATTRGQVAIERQRQHLKAAVVQILDDVVAAGGIGRKKQVGLRKETDQASIAIDCKTIISR